MWKIDKKWTWIEHTVSVCGIGKDANSDMFRGKDKEKINKVTCE